MALYTPIQTTNPWDSMGDLADFISKKKQHEELRKLKEQELSMDMPLKKAKAQEASMIAKLMGNALGIPNEQGQEFTNKNNMGSQNQIKQPYQMNEAEKDAVSQMKPGDSLKVGSSQSSISPDNNEKKARDILIALGYLKESPSDQQAREVSTSFQKNAGANAAKQLEGWGKTITASHEMKTILEHNQEIMANPVFQDMYSHPEYMGYDISYLKKFGTPKQIELASSLGTNTKSLFSSMASEFKGAFREFEKKMFEDAAPNTKDTLQQLIAKNNTMLAMRELMTKRLSLASDIVQSSEGRISPNSALDIAEKQINSKDIRNKIKDNFKNEMKKQEKPKQEKINEEKYSEEELMQFYNDSISAGAPESEAKKRLDELRGQL